MFTFSSLIFFFCFVSLNVNCVVNVFFLILFLLFSINIFCCILCRCLVMCVVFVLVFLCVFVVLFDVYVVWLGYFVYDVLCLVCVFVVFGYVFGVFLGLLFVIVVCGDVMCVWVWWMVLIFSVILFGRKCGRSVCVVLVVWVCGVWVVCVMMDNVYVYVWCGCVSEDVNECVRMVWWSVDAWVMYDVVRLFDGVVGDVNCECWVLGSEMMLVMLFVGDGCVWMGEGGVLWVLLGVFVM